MLTWPSIQFNGNALRRQSTDIDLFTAQKITPESMQKYMEKNFGDRVEVYAKSDLGIRGYLDGIKFDMIHFPYPMQHKHARADTIRFLELNDAVAMKVHAVANRGLRRDFYDLAEILQKMPLNEVLLNYQKQFNPSPKAMEHTRRSLTYMGDAEVDSAKVAVRNGRSWDQVRKIIAKAVNSPSQIPYLKEPIKQKATNPHLVLKQSQPIPALAPKVNSEQTDRQASPQKKNVRRKTT
jgi:hypothetical protein